MMGENGFEDIGKGEAVRAVWFGLVVLFGSGGDGYGGEVVKQRTGDCGLRWLIEEDRTEMMADDLVVLCGDGDIGTAWI